MAFQRWQRAMDDTGGSELNVIPVMNLFMVLIPFLMLGAAFYHIGVIPVSTPTHNPAEGDVPKTPTIVTANVVITADSLKLSFSSTGLTEEELGAMSAQWDAKGGKFDLDGLQNKLKAIKVTYPKSSTVVVLPDDSVEYQNLVGVLDTMREYKSGVDAAGEPKYSELFPVTVFSRFIPPPPPEEGGAGEDDMNFTLEEDGPTEGAAPPTEGAAPAPTEEEAP